MKAVPVEDIDEVKAQRWDEFISLRRKRGLHARVGPNPLTSPETASIIYATRLNIIRTLCLSVLDLFKSSSLSST